MDVCESLRHLDECVEDEDLWSVVPLSGEVVDLIDQVAASTVLEVHVLRLEGHDIAAAHLYDV